MTEVIHQCREIEVEYKLANGTVVFRRIKSVAIVFSEFYFYLIAYLDKANFTSPTIYRVDRIISYKRLGNKFYIPYAKRFEDGEFRKRIQFMYRGDLMKVKFEFYGDSVEAVLDRLPTAKVVEKNEKGVVIEAEVYGKGIVMWLLSQGELVKVLEPEELIENIKDKMVPVCEMYEIFEELN